MFLLLLNVKLKINDLSFVNTEKFVFTVISGVAVDQILLVTLQLENKILDCLVSIVPIVTTILKTTIFKLNVK